MTQPTYVKIEDLSLATGLTKAWLRKMASEGKIPCLKEKNRLRFNVEAVKAALAEMEKR